MCGIQKGFNKQGRPSSKYLLPPFLDQQPVLVAPGKKGINILLCRGVEFADQLCILEVQIVSVEANIPPAGVITTTASIAVVATTSALLAKPFADILLKVVKPTVKKVLKKIAAIRGKQLKVESVRERQVEQRLRNEAISKLKSVAAKTKKK